MSSCPRCHRPIVQNLVSCGACGAPLAPFSTAKIAALGVVVFVGAAMLIGFFAAAVTV
jgi:hypothetical protein